MKKILINGNRYQEDYLVPLASFLWRLVDSGRVEMKVERDFYTYLRSAFPGVTDMVGVVAEGFEPALVLSIGGDGTFLATALLVGDRQTPIMGINSGHLGYLAAAKISEVDLLVNAILEDDYVISPRTVIEVEYVGNLTGGHLIEPRPSPMYALNEVAFMKQDTASMIDVTTTVVVPQIASAPPYCMTLANYLGDGLIVSTPTGSTGYNLSVGGPIVAPSASNFILSPIAAHALTMRPLVMPDSVEFDMVTSSRTGQFLLSVDGRSKVYPAGSIFHLRKAPFVVNLVHLPDHNFIDTLRTKLLWGVNNI